MAFPAPTSSAPEDRGAVGFPPSPRTASVRTRRVARLGRRAGSARIRGRRARPPAGRLGGGCRTVGQNPAV